MQDNNRMTDLERRKERDMVSLPEMREDNETPLTTEETTNSLAALGIEERYRLITEMLSDVICETDINGAVRYVSPSCRRTLGYDPEQLAGRTIFDYVHPDDVAEALIAFHRAIQEKAEGRAEVRYRRADGRYVWVEALGRTICDWTGEAVGAMLIVRDITERINKEQDLRRLNAIGQAALNSTTDGLFALDRNFQYTVFNRRHAELMEHLFGTQVKLGQKIHDLIPNEEDRARVVGFLEPLLHGERMVRQVFCFKTERGEIDCDVSGNPILNAEGEVVGLVVVSRDVTKEYRAQQRRSEQLFFLSTLLDGIPVPVFYKDRHARYLGMNKAFEKLFGVRREQLVGKTVFDLFPEVKAAPLAALNEQVLTTQEPVMVPGTFENPAGQTLQMLVHLAPFKDRSDELAGLVGVLVDITDLKEAKKRLAALLEQNEKLVHELRLQQAYFKQLFAAAPEAVAIIDTDGVIIDVNPAFERLFQYTQDEVSGHRFIDLIVPPEQVDDEAARWSPSSQLDLLRTETVRKRKDGTKIPVAISASPISLDNNRLGIYAIYQDLTERKAAEARLRQLSRAVEQSPASIVITDTTGAIEYVNPKFCQITGYAAEEVLGKNPRILKSGETPPEVYRNLWETITAGKEWIGEFHNKTKHGDLYWELAHISPITDADGTITHYVAVKEDITERKSIEALRAHFEEELRKRNAELEESIEKIKKMQSGLIQSEKMASLGLLTAGIAHEINNPLAFISSNINRFEEYFNDVKSLVEKWKKLGTEDGLKQMYGSMLAALETFEQEIDLPFIEEDFKNLMQHAKEGIERIRSIVDQLRGFSHVNTEVTDDVSVEQALDDTVVLAWNEIKYKATVVREYGNIPPVRCSGGELKQVLVNLLVNAAQAIEKSGTITLRTSVKDGFAVIEVEDTGCGIPEEILPKIFDPFFTTKPVGKGTGLGLWISATIVQKYGGSIRAESRVGTGTRFTIQMPLSRAGRSEA